MNSIVLPTNMAKSERRIGSLAMVRQPVKEKERQIKGKTNYRKQSFSDLNAHDEQYFS